MFFVSTPPQLREATKRWQTVWRTEKYIGGDNYENISSKNLNINSNNPTINNEMASTKKESQTNSITLKFWKLISENKLVSSFVLVVILWAIKEIFDIDLKI